MGRPVDADSSATFERIVATAHDLLAESPGADFPSLRAVAARSDVSLGTVQYYFRTKRDLIEACLDVLQKDLDAVCRASFARVSQGEKLEVVIADLFRFARRVRHLLRLRATMTVPAGLSPPRHRDAMGAIARDAALVLAPRVGIAPDEVRLTLHAVTPIVTRFVMMSDEEASWVTGRPPNEAHEALAAFLGRAARRLLESNAARDDQSP
ncbi:MAG: TetR family transcriptional regulator [Myxococcota bacterium]